MSALSISSRFSPDFAIPHDAVPAVAKVERSAAWVLSFNYPGQALFGGDYDRYQRNRK